MSTNITKYSHLANDALAARHRAALEAREESRTVAKRRAMRLALREGVTLMSDTKAEGFTDEDLAL